MALMSFEKAVFDVDGTQFKSACVEKIIDIAIKRGVFQPSTFEQAFESRRRWQASNNEGVYQTYLHHLVGGFITSIAGVKVEQLDEITADMVAKHRVRKYQFTAELNTILKPNHTTLAVSGSPRIVIEPFLASAGFDKFIGSELEVVDGVFTGRAESVDKTRVLDEELGPAEQLAVGIGDTVGDVPVLTRSLCAIAFNPSATLRKIAVENGWYIVMEQKDAITQLLPNNGAYQVIFDRSPTVVLDHAGVRL